MVLLREVYVRHNTDANIVKYLWYERMDVNVSTRQKSQKIERKCYVNQYRIL